MRPSLILKILAVLLIANAIYGDAQRVILAEDIRKEILEGKPVMYHGVLISGDLYLDSSLLNLSNERDRYRLFNIKSIPIPPIIIINSTIQGSVDFPNTNFEN
jgi:hypothetical protein